jgi:multidrug efflux pump
VEDPNQEELDEWSGKLVAKFRTLPELEDVVTDQQPNGTALELKIDRQTASRLGVTPQTLDDTLYDAYGQRQVTTLYTQTNQYHVILETLPQFNNNPDRLQDIYLQGSSSSAASGSSGSAGAASGGATSGSSKLTASSTSGISATTSSSSTLTTTSSSSHLSSSSGGGSLSSGSTGTILQTSSSSGSSGMGNSGSNNTGTGSTSSTGISGSGGGGTGSSNTTNNSINPIPLDAIISLKKSLEPLTITHQAQFPAVTISFNLAPHAHLSQAVHAIEEAEKSLKLPINVVTGFQGTAASYQNSLTNEGLLVLAALMTVYIVLGVLYESYIHPLTILSTLPSAGVGALLALELFGQDLGIVGIIGIVLLIGIVKKNGIMMVDFALQAEREEGKNPREAIYSACLLRLRPILMTTLAALLGSLPLALGTGIGAELRKPLGIAMVGGLLLSQVLTLYTTPVIYLFFDRMGARFAGRKASASVGEPLRGEA